MCVQSIRVPIRKKSGNLSYAPRKYYNDIRSGRVHSFRFFFAKWHINLHGLFNTKPIHVERTILRVILSNPLLESSYLSKGISPKVNVLAWQEFELAYYDVAVLHVSHNAAKTPSLFVLDSNKQLDKYPNAQILNGTFKPGVPRSSTQKGHYVLWERHSAPRTR